LQVRRAYVEHEPAGLAITRNAIFFRSGFKILDRVREQGVRRIKNGAYTSVREYFNPRDNAVIGR
jgi:hypothetical protein